MLLKEAFKFGIDKLTNKVKNPELEVRLLLKHLLGVNDVDFITKLNTLALGSYKTLFFKNYLKKRLKGIPLAYILQQKGFWKDDFYVNNNVLIPRADTETLIIATLKEFKDQEAKLDILDVGTGSGCIVLSLLKEYKHSRGVGVDVFAKIAHIVNKNAKNLNVLDRFQFLKSDMFKEINGKFDLIVSNPPYIAFNDSDIDKEVKKYEPATALFANNNGLYFYEEIFSKAFMHLKVGGKIIIEIGHKQKEDVIKIAQGYGFAIASLYEDMAGIPRALVFCYNK